jgi:hypothetical protein
MPAATMHCRLAATKKSREKRQFIAVDVERPVLVNKVSGCHPAVTTGMGNPHQMKALLLTKRGCVDRPAVWIIKLGQVETTGASRRVRGCWRIAVH